jgi:hypothetical protein
MTDVAYSARACSRPYLGERVGETSPRHLTREGPEMKYAFIHRNQSVWTISVQCPVLHVSVWDTDSGGNLSAINIAGPSSQL